MPLFDFVKRIKWSFVFLGCSLFFSVIALAQINLPYRLIKNYLLASNATVNKGKITLIECNDAETFNNSFQPASTDKRPEGINFAKEMVVGIALVSTNKPPKLSVSKVFVQDSVLTVRYIRLADTTLTNNPQPLKTQPLLLLAIPKQPFLKTKLVENGKVVLMTKKSDED